MRKRELVVGVLVPGTKLRVLGPAPSDPHGNQRVRVRCEWVVKGSPCDTEKVMRVTDMTRKPYEDKNGKLRLPHRSCGCQSKLAHQRYWESRAKGIRRLVHQQIYRAHVWRGRTFATLAKQRDMPVQLVTTIFRLYARRMKDRGRLH